MEYIIPFLIVCVFAVVVFILAKKEHEADKAIVQIMPEEVKQELENAPMRSVEGIPNGAAVTGYVFKIKKQNQTHAWLTVMYYNRYFPNFRGEILSVTLKVLLADMQANNIGEGSYMLMLFNEDKTPKPIFM